MKIKELLLAALALAVAFSCNREKGALQEEQNSDWNTRYMGFSISTPAGTKAAPGTYEDGKPYESQINTVHFFFYRDGAFVSWGYGDMSKAFNEDPSSEEGISDELNDGGTPRQGVVVLESTMTEPNQVLCVVNSQDYTFYKNKPLSEIMKALHTGKEGVTQHDTETFKDFYYEEGGKPYFVMFTSPMYGKDVTEHFEIKNVTDIIAAKHIFKTRAEAKAHPLDIYVERIATRMDINNWNDLVGTDGYIKKAHYEGSAMLDAGNEPIYDIKPVSWSVTAVSNNAYDLKHVDINWFSQRGTGQPFYGWLESGNSVPNAFIPAEMMRTRINWAYDPYYTDPEPSDRDSYPHSARELHEKNLLTYWSAKNVQDYYTAASDPATETTKNGILQRYAYENPLNASKNESPRINGTMLLMTAQMKKKGAASFEDMFGYMGNYVTYAEYVAQARAAASAYIRPFVLDGGTTFRLIKDEELKLTKAVKIEDVYTNNKASYENVWNKPSKKAGATGEVKDVWKDYLVDLEGNIKLSDIDAALPPLDYTLTDKKMKAYSDGYVTLVPDFTKTGTLYVKDPASTDPVTPTLPGYDSSDPSTWFRPATPAEIAQVFLHDVVAPANHFKDGLMYYAIPLEHFGTTEGKYGTVRNNLYSVTIDKIKSVGHGIHDENEPIVPGDRKEPFFVAAKVNILSWQMVTQTANLEE